jgi:5-formyltetrahydrofolate cyclo-ligase
LDQFGRGIYAAYLPIRSELSPLPLIARLADLSIQTAMPITPAPGNPLDFRLWATGDKLDDGPYDTKQPAANAPVCQPDVILAPMLAFDSACWRLGYGGGFYDRSIGGLRQAGHKVVAIGIAFAGQQVEQVPTGPYDMALDAVLTPDGLLMPA